MFTPISLRTPAARLSARPIAQRSTAGRALSYSVAAQRRGRIMAALSESYSIWLEPAQPLLGTMQREIDTQCAQHDAPRFEPHVTLVGGVETGREDMLAKAEQLAAQLQPFRINFLDVSYGASFHQCVYILAAKEWDLLAAGAAARAAYGLDAAAPYMPHLSLLYADIPQEERAAAATAAIGRLYGEGADYATLIRQAGFDAASLTVWFTPVEDKTLASWVRVAEYPLTGGGK